MGLSRYLRSVLASRRTTSAALARAIGVHPTYLYRWLSGKGFPNEKQFQLLCRHFSASADEILDLKPGAGEGRLPILAAVDCGLFNPASLAPHDDVEWVTVPGELLSQGPRTSQGKGDAFALRPRGDSMEPTIRASSLLILRAPRRSEALEPDTIVAAAFDLESDPAQAAVKMLRYSADRRMAILESLNQKYPPIVRPAKEIRIEGIVTAVIDPKGIRVLKP